MLIYVMNKVYANLKEYLLKGISALKREYFTNYRKHSGAAEGLTVITGNHERRIGRFYRTITEADKQLVDKDVIVEEDCWIGTRVVLLMGVTVRRGTTVAAGAVVSKSTAPYSIVGGTPAKHIKFYWTINQILEHEAILYPEEERYTKEQLEDFFEKYQKG